MRFAIILSQFNKEINLGLLEGAKAYLKEQNVPEDRIEVFSAPGAFEIPLLAKKIAKTDRFAGVICLGTVIKGDTAHFEFISLGAAVGMMQASLETEVPISFGVLTTYTEEQAQVRSQKDEHNKGKEAASACYQLVLELKKISN